MDITVFHRDFKTQLLVIRTAGVFFSSQVILNGVRIRAEHGCFMVSNDVGIDVAVRLKGHWFSPLPTVTIDNEDVHLASYAGWGKSVTLSRTV